MDGFNSLREDRARATEGCIVRDLLGVGLGLELGLGFSFGVGRDSEL